MGYYDLPDVPYYEDIGRSKPKAKKLYKCSHCSQDIKVGEQHNKHVVKDEGGAILTERYHLACPWEEGMVCLP